MTCNTHMGDFGTIEVCLLSEFFRPTPFSLPGCWLVDMMRCISLETVLLSTMGWIGNDDDDIVPMDGWMDE